MIVCLYSRRKSFFFPPSSPPPFGQKKLNFIPQESPFHLETEELLRRVSGVDRSVTLHEEEETENPSFDFLFFLFC